MLISVGSTKKTLQHSEYTLDLPVYNTPNEALWAAVKYHLCKYPAPPDSFLFIHPGTCNLPGTQRCLVTSKTLLTGLVFLLTWWDVIHYVAVVQHICIVWVFPWRTLCPLATGARCQYWTFWSPHVRGEMTFMLN